MLEIRNKFKIRITEGSKPDRSLVIQYSVIVSDFGFRISSFLPMIFFVVLLILTFLAQIAEFFIPPLDWMYDARIYIVPVIVFYGAMSLPFPLVMSLAFFAGFMLDALTAQVLGNRVEISIGWSILLYAVLAAIMHGLRPSFIRGRWEVHCIMSGICASAIILAQYLMISFWRGS